MNRGTLLEFGPFTLNARERSLKREGTSISLTPKAFEVLVALVENAGSVVTKDELLKRVWPDTFVEEANLVQHIFTLRKALGDAGNYIETVPKLGYRFTEQVRQGGENAPAPVQGSRKPIVVWLGAAAVIGTLAWVVATFGFSSDPVKRRVSSIAVLPFVNLGNGTEDEYFSDGLTEEITDAVTRIDGIRVAARTSAFQFKGKQYDVRRIGKEIGVASILEGSVRRDKNRLRITAQFVETDSGFHVWSKTWDREAKDVFAVQREIAQAVADSVPGGSVVRTKPLTENFEAYNLFLQGRFQRTKISGASMEQSVSLLEKAIAADPNFAMAHAMLADCYTDMGYMYMRRPREMYPLAQKAVGRALEQDDSLSFAHSVQGFILMHYDRQWDHAERELKRAIELDPRDAAARHNYSHLLVSQRRFDESLEQSKRSLDLDPVNPRFLGHLVWHHLWARNMSSALEYGNQLIDSHAGHGTAFYVVWTHEQAGDFQKAIQVRRGLGLSEEDARTLTKAVESSGAAAYWRFFLSRNLARGEKADPLGLARLYARLGEQERAIQSLERAFAERVSWLVYLNGDPAFDNLRSDARFDSIVKRVGIPQ